MGKAKWVRTIVWVAMLGLITAGQCAVEDPGGGDGNQDGDADAAVPWNLGAALTVYVVNEPAGAAEFRELPEALSYLCGQLPDTERGAVVIRTERQLRVDTLTFDCPVSIEADAGVFPVIVGPGETPLTVNAAAGLALTGLTITNAAGVTLNTPGGHLDLENSILPQGITINIGPPATTSKSARQRQGTSTSANWKIASNQLGQGLKLNLASNLDATSKCTLSDNQGHTCSLSGNGSMAGELTYRANLFNVIDIDTKLRASAKLNLADHYALDGLMLNLQSSDSPEVTLSNNVTASARISILGEASATLTMTANNIQDGEVKFGVSDLEINALGTTWGRLALLATAAAASPILHYTELDSKIEGTFSLTALEAGTENAKVTVALNNVDAQSNFEVDVKCQVKFVLSGNTAIRGTASVKVDGNVYEMEEAKVKWDAGLMLEATGINAGIKVSSKAGTYKDNFAVFSQPTTTLTIELTDAIFEGGMLGISKSGKPQSGQKPIRTAQAAGDSVTLRNVRWTEPTLAIGIQEIEGPVTIENCQIAASLQAMTLYDVQGPITVKDNACQLRIAFNQCAGLVTVQGNTFAPNNGAGPDVWLWDARGLIQNNVMPNGLLVAGGNGYARATSNQIGGHISIGLGAYLYLKDNTLTGASLQDDLAGTGGLVNNPVFDNVGLDPGDTYTLVDFNGNGCADYPPLYDERHDDGKCFTDGVPVPPDPGL